MNTLASLPAPALVFHTLNHACDFADGVELVGDTANFYSEAQMQSALATPEQPVVNIKCETVDDGITGRTSLNVVRVETEDDGSFTAVTDHWPGSAVQGETVEDRPRIPTRPRCHRCQRYITIDTDADDDLWLEVIGPLQGPGYICADCFTRAADERLIRWEGRLRLVPISLAAQTDIQARVEAGDFTTTTPPAPAAEQDEDDCMNETIGELLAKGFKVTIEPDDDATQPEACMTEGDKITAQNEAFDIAESMQPEGKGALARGVAQWVIAALGDLTSDYAAMTSEDVEQALLANVEHAPVGKGASALRPSAEMSDRVSRAWDVRVNHPDYRPTTESAPDGMLEFHAGWYAALEYAESVIAVALAGKKHTADMDCPHCVNGIVPMTMDRPCKRCHGSGRFAGKEGA